MCWSCQDTGLHCKALFTGFWIFLLTEESVCCCKEESLGLSFNISVFDQSNVTECIHIGRNPNNKICPQENKYTTFPNLLGQQDAHQAEKDIEMLMRLKLVYDADRLSAPVYKCHQHLVKSVCYMIYPTCYPKDHMVMHLCKEMCQELLHACWNKTVQQIQNILVVLEKKVF